MTNRIEDATQGYADRRWPVTTPALDPELALFQTISRDTATHLSEWLLSPENVERMARAVHEHIWPEENWDDMPEQYQQDIMAQERAAIRAIIEGEGS